MNRDDLDGWFARADDVLTDWHGSPDAMDTAQPEWPSWPFRVAGAATSVSGWRIEADREALERSLQTTGQQMTAFAEAVGRVAATIRPAFESLARAVVPLAAAESRCAADPAPDPWERALEARRTRNTGPPDRHRLDGRRTRR